MNILLHLYKSLLDSTIYLESPIYNTFTTHRTYFSYQSTKSWHRNNEETLFKLAYILLQYFVKRAFAHCIFFALFLAYLSILKKREYEKISKNGILLLCKGGFGMLFDDMNNVN